jgi:mycoredoxin
MVEPWVSIRDSRHRMTGGFMPRRLLGPWLLSAAVGGVGLVEGILFSAQGRPLPAVLAIAVLGFMAWVVSPAAFPRSPSGWAVDEPPGAGGGIVIYWRPGCMYCLRLRWSLGRLARRATWVDIWADEDAAAFVRGVNDGNETVPTVVAENAVRTNPDVGWVRRALQEG